MGNSPWFDEPGLIDYRRTRLTDTDGSGTTDILYIESFAPKYSDVPSVASAPVSGEMPETFAI